MRFLARVIGKWQWLRWGIRYRLYEKIAGDYEFSAPFFGFKYRGNLISAVDRSVYVYGAYEREILELMCKYIHSDDTVLDIGANVGNFTNTLRRLNCKVISVEPQLNLANNIRKRFSKEIGRWASKNESYQSEYHFLEVDQSEPIT